MIDARILALAEIGISVTAALVVGGSWIRRASVGVLLLAGAILPWLAPPKPVPRVLLAFLAAIPILKTVQIAYTTGPWSAGLRVWHALVPFDVRRVRRLPPALEGRVLGSVVLHAVIGTLAVLGLLRVRGLTGPAPELARVLGGAALCYGWLEATSGVVRLVHRLLGLEVPPIQRAPILAKSLGEFWGERWNRPVEEWLHRFVFQPLVRRRRPTLGLLSAFGVSAAFHAWMVAPAVGPAPALSMAAFFLVQGMAVLVEQRLGVRDWPAPAARCWTFLMLLAPLPLFLNPFWLVLGV